ncbi:MAG: hypothetical protein IKN56_06515 [Clostridia bacterium]|nr:hypothetical protein [Clostridia bacterium]
MGEYNDCIDSHADEETDDVKVFTCEVCGKKYYDLANYNACLDEHRNGTEHNYEHYIGVTLPELAQKLVASFNSSGVPALIKELITKVLDYIQDFIIYGAASRAAD